VSLSSCTFSGWNDSPVGNSRLLRQCSRDFHRTHSSLMTAIHFCHDIYTNVDHFTTVLMNMNFVLKTSLQFIDICQCVQSSWVCNMLDINCFSEFRATLLWYFTNMKAHLILTPFSSNIKILNIWHYDGVNRTDTINPWNSLYQSPERKHVLPNCVKWL
jgi:hypothetical protein